MQDLISFTELMAHEAGEIARRYFRQNPEIETKDDASPVTIADKSIERKLREMIEVARPRDGFLGEEFGTKESDSGLMWVVDPIDGTKSFIAGRPSFGTLIALWDGDMPLLGAIYQPITDELWIGAQEHPTTLNNHRISTRKNPPPKKLRIGSTSPAQFDDKPELLKALRDHADFFIWGGDCYLYGLLAQGGLDVVIETGLSAYDYAPMPAIIHGAGGLTCSFGGRPLTLKNDVSLLAIGDESLKEPLITLIAEYD